MGEGNRMGQALERASALSGVVVVESLVSVPGARAFHLDERTAGGPPEAFQAHREFAHIHPTTDGSLHLTLPPQAYAEVLEKGWGEPHPMSGTMMVFGPRDEGELEVVWSVLLRSYRYATGRRAGDERGQMTKIERRTTTPRGRAPRSESARCGASDREKRRPRLDPTALEPPR